MQNSYRALLMKQIGIVMQRKIWEEQTSGKHHDSIYGCIKIGKNYWFGIVVNMGLVSKSSMKA